MQPRFLTGDMVQVSPSRLIMGPYVRGMVISVQQSNSVPDAKERGLENIQQWSYWVVTSDGPYIVGPIGGAYVYPFPGPTPQCHLT